MTPAESLRGPLQQWKEEVDKKFIKQKASGEIAFEIMVWSYVLPEILFFYYVLLGFISVISAFSTFFF